MTALAEVDEVTRAHMVAQLQVSRVAQAEAAALWRVLQLSTLEQSLPGWLESQARVVLAARRQSALLAARYYNGQRVDQLGAGVPQGVGMVRAGGVTIPREALAVTPDTVQRVATAARVTGPVRVYQSLAMGRPAEVAMQYGLKGVLGSTQRLVLDGGRGAMGALLRSEPRTTYYERVTDGDPCDFCTMLASRGAVYTATTGKFEAHDYCGCSLRPVFRASKRRQRTGSGNKGSDRVVIDAPAPLSPLR